MNIRSIRLRLRAARAARTGAPSRLRIAKTAGGIFLFAVGLILVGLGAAPPLLSPVTGVRAAANLAAAGDGSAAVPNAARTDKCANVHLKELPKSKICTHGPDPAPPGFDVARRVPPLAKSVARLAPQVLCIDDGVSGPRVQVIYARAADVPSRYAVYLPSFRQWASDADQYYQASAAETGGSRRIRYVTDANCAVVVANVTLSATGDDTFDNTITELRAQGYNRTDRKYMIFVDTTSAGICGIGGIWGDDRLTPDNRNNSGPSYGRTDAGCWGGYTAAHELMHNLGGVQMSAPHTSKGWHCIDEYDIMCYSDSPYFPDMRYLCPDTGHEYRLDCGHDDYFSTNPAAGGYLATHWNAANNKFLAASDAPPPPPCPDADFEPDDSAAQARSVTVGATETHAFCGSANDQDWVRFDAVAGFAYRIETLDLASGVDTVLQLYDSDGATPIASDDNGAGGRASLIRHVPAVSGRLYVKARPKTDGDGGASAAYKLRITGVRLDPALALTSASGPVGDAVGIRLSGFPGDQPVDLQWDGSKQTTATTDADGAAAVSLVAPPATKGRHTIRAVAGGVATAATFTVTPSLDVSPTSGPAGQSVTVALNGYKANEKVAVTWFNSRKKRVKVASVAASPLGAATATFTVPNSAKVGNHKVRGHGRGGSTASATFSVSASAAESLPNEAARPPAARADGASTEEVGAAGLSDDHKHQNGKQGRSRNGKGDQRERATASDQRRPSKQGESDVNARAAASHRQDVASRSR